MSVSVQITSDHTAIQAAIQATTPARERYAPQPRLATGTLAATAAAHLGLIATLVSMEVVPLPPPLTALMVEIIPPAVEAAPPVAAKVATPVAMPHPEPVPAAPPAPPVHKRPQQQRPQPHPAASPEPLLAAAASTPLADNAPAPAPSAAAEHKPEAPTAAPSAPQPHLTPAPARPAPATPPEVVAARYDADYLRNPAPAYPALSRRLGEEGRVILRVFVDAAGLPGDIEVRSSSGAPRLDQAARAAVTQWKFIPARRGDENVGAWVLVPIQFTLKH